MAAGTFVTAVVAVTAAAALVSKVAAVAVVAKEDAVVSKDAVTVDLVVVETPGTLTETLGDTLPSTG